MRKKFKAYSLVELVLAIGIFASVVSYIVFFSVDALSTLGNFRYRVKMDLVRDHVFEQFTTLKRYSWQQIVDNVKGTPMYIDVVNDRFEIRNGTQDSNGMSYSFSILNVYRDANGNIVGNPGTLDPHTFKVAIQFNWEDLLGRLKNEQTSFYVSDWNTYRWLQTTQTEFNNGTKSNTVTTNVSGGEVQLNSVVYSDWCKPQNTLTSFDLPGQGVATTISAQPSTAYMGTGANASGLSFIRSDITHTEPPTMQVHGTFDGYKTNDSFGSGNYAYLATDTNAKEVVIIDISTGTYTESGYFDAPGNTDANAVYKINDIGIVGTGSNIYLFNLTASTGSRAQIGSAIAIGGTVTGIYALDNYVYVANSSTTQLKIIDITNPGTASIVGTALVNGNGGTGVFATSNRVYLTTSVNSTKNEFFVIDTTTKTGSKSVISSIDLEGMSPRNVNKVADDRAVVVGTGGNEYQVFDLSNESSITRCGQLNIDSGVNDSVGVTLPNDDTYTYIVTGDTAGELKIIKGGEGGGDANGNGYISTGNYTSDVLDTQSANAVYHYISTVSSLPLNTTLKFQLRTSNDAQFSGVSFVGPDGTSNTYFDNLDTFRIPNSFNNNRYFQVKYFFTSNTISTPVINSFTLNYGK